MKIFLLAMSLFLSSNNLSERASPPLPPSLDLSAIRAIDCSKEDGSGFIGSGFLIGNGVLATAEHVAALSHTLKCIDVETGVTLKAYKEDPTHDFGLMTGKLPTDIPYIKYKCDGMKPKQTYMSYGITDYGQTRLIFRMDAIVATKEILKDDDAVIDIPHSSGMRVLTGFVAPGMSGGPVVDSQGYAVAVNNAGGLDDTLLFDLKDTMLCHN